MIENQFPAIAIVDKPADMTSSEVIQKLKKKMSYQRIGHGGTLDPFATGLLPVFINSYTKIASLFHEADKQYVAVLELGAKTDTGDLTGEVVYKKRIPAFTAMQCRLLERSLLGSQRLQIPIYSAKKISGTPMYKLARENKVHKSNHFQNVTIHSLSIETLSSTKLKITAKVSSGTYMRSLAELVAQKLQTVGHLISLRRTAYYLPSGVEISQGASYTAFENEYLNYSYYEQELSKLIPAIKLSRSRYRDFTTGLMKVIPTYISGWHLVQRQDLSPMGIVSLEKGRISQRIFL